MRRAVLLILALLVATGAYSQTFTRPLELTTPRMNGPDVLAIQQRLVGLGFSKIGPADGWFGPLTKNAISEYQRFYGYENNGVVDRGTWNSLLVNSTMSSKIDEAIIAANRLLASPHELVSRDIEGRTTEGGHVDQYLDGTRALIENYAFFGEMGKVEYEVFHLVEGLVVLVTEYHYPEQFDIAHADKVNSAFYFLGKMSVRISNGHATPSLIEDLEIRDLIGKTGT